MSVIYKYHLQVISTSQDQKLVLPDGFKILSMQNQDDEITFWAEVNPGNISKPRRFRVFGTGWGIMDNEGFEHIGTVQIGSLVWHVYME